MSWCYELIHIKLCYQGKEEKTMVNKKFWLGILVMTLVFGMVVVGCGDGKQKKLAGNTDNSTGIRDGETSLSGTWETDSSSSIGPVIEFSGANFTFMGRSPLNNVLAQGTYVIYDGKIGFTYSSGTYVAYSFSRSGNMLTINTFPYKRK